MSIFMVTNNNRENHSRDVYKPIYSPTMFITENVYNHECLYIIILGYKHPRLKTFSVINILDYTRSVLGYDFLDYDSEPIFIKISDSEDSSEKPSTICSIINCLLALGLVYLFLCSINLLGDSFEVLGKQLAFFSSPSFH